jgi:hypothetical protein
MNATILPLLGNTAKENPSKVAHWTENIRKNLHRDFKRLLGSLNTQTLYPESSDGHFNSKNSDTLWKILISCRQILEETSDHYQGVIKFQTKVIKSWMSRLKSCTILPKSLDLDQIIQL